MLAWPKRGAKLACPYNCMYIDMSPLFSTLSKFPEDRTSKLKKITEIDGSINHMANFHLFKFPGEFDAMIQDHISKKLPKGINE